MDEVATKRRKLELIVTAPYDTRYGSREFTCRDPEFQVWRVGSYAGEPLES